MVVLEGGAVSYERGTSVTPRLSGGREWRRVPSRERIVSFGAMALLACEGGGVLAKWKCKVRFYHYIIRSSRNGAGTESVIEGIFVFKGFLSNSENSSRRWLVKDGHVTRP